MITLLFGENSFEIDRAWRKLAADFSGTAEVVEALGADREELLSIFMGQSLFSEKRLVILTDMSEKSEYWSMLPDWIEKISDMTHVVLVEGKLDKRTATYKWLQKNVTSREYTLWGERDTHAAEAWALQEAKGLGITLTPGLASMLVRRAGVDQWRLLRALEKLQLVDEITEDSIETHIDPHPEENVFTLLDIALKGSRDQLQQKIVTLKDTEDAYKVVGLLHSQLMQLAALIYSDKSSAEVARDIKAHPFVMSKLASHANGITKSQIRQLLDRAAKTDIQMKTVTVDPWIPVEQLLHAAAQIGK